MAVSPRAEKLITAGDDKQVKVWDLPAGTLAKTLTGLPGSPTALAVSGDGKRGAAGTATGKARVWSVAVADQWGEITVGAGRIDGLCLNDDGSVLYARQMDRVITIDLMTGVATPADAARPPLVVAYKDKTWRIRRTDEGIITAEGKPAWKTERAYGTFSRSFTLPHNVDPSKVEAKFADGILTLTIPKTAASRPRKIAIH